jgi:hypothetical protein
MLFELLTASQLGGPGSIPGNMGFVVDKVFSEYFGFPCQFSFHRLLHTHLPSGAGTIGPLLAGVPSGISLTAAPKMKSKKFWEELIAYFP